MKKVYFICFILCFSCMACNNQMVEDRNQNPTIADNSQTVTYQADNSVLTNPEKGLYQATSTRSSNPEPLTEEFLATVKEEEKKTLIFRLYYLEKFYEAPISSSFLEMIQRDFNVIREAGFKIILRFAYTSSYPDSDPPYNDSPTEDLLHQHIDQLAPIIQQNSDVILTLQNGFYGIWGENFYSDVFGSESDGPLSEQMWEKRRRVTDRLLDVLPDDRFVSVRDPSIKAEMYGLEMPGDSVTAATAYQGDSPVNRVGYHNDCFLASANDLTFGNTDIEKPYWEAESKYTIMGGETCRDTPEFTTCPNALTDLQNAHWTYLNDDYNGDVLDRWREEGCYQDVRKRLGYRLALEEATFQESAEGGSTFSYSLTINNTGFAGPANPRDAFLVFTSDSETYRIPISSDPRTWYSGTRVVEESVELPSDMPKGTYRLHMYLPDPEESLADRADYAIQLANQDVWDPSTGYNYLHAEVIIN